MGGGRGGGGARTTNRAGINRRYILATLVRTLPLQTAPQPDLTRTPPEDAGFAYLDERDALLEREVRREDGRLRAQRLVLPLQLVVEQRLDERLARAGHAHTHALVVADRVVAARVGRGGQGAERGGPAWRKGPRERGGARKGGKWRRRARARTHTLSQAAQAEGTRGAAHLYTQPTPFSYM